MECVDVNTDSEVKSLQEPSLEYTMSSQKTPVQPETSQSMADDELVDFPTPARPPIKLQMLQNKNDENATGMNSPPPRIGSGNKMQRQGSASSIIEQSKQKAEEKKSSKSKPQAPKFKLNNVPIEEVISELELRWKRVKERDDLTRDVADDLEYFTACAKLSNRTTRKPVVKKMDDMGLVDMMRNVWAQNYPLFGTEEDDSNRGYNNMKFIMVVMWNTTDMLTETCDTILESGFYKDMLQVYLDGEQLHPQAKKSVKKVYLTKGLMGILHNMLQRSDARELIREIQGVEILTKFRESKNEFIQIKTEILLAYLIDEKQNELINSDDKTFLYLIKVLTDCLKNGTLSGDHYSTRFGYCAREVLSALNMLAVNDSNKQKIVDCGLLPILVKMMKLDESTPDEQLQAGKMIWNLSFHAESKQKILDEPGCIEGVHDMSINGATDEVKKTAFGALWVLKIKSKNSTNLIKTGKGGKNTTKAKSPEIPQAEQATNPDGPHIFISYNWGSKPTMLIVRDHLKALGYNVWMDVDDMSGSILEAMALAVEHAVVVVVCLSSKYKESPNCRTEGEYAFKKRKVIVPLRLEPKYLPDGWLGALVGNSLFFDISSKDKLEANFDKFVKELGNRGKLNGASIATTETYAPPSHSFSSGAPNIPDQMSNQSKVSKWTKNDIRNWLKENDIHEGLSRFDDFNGELILELKCVLRDAPEYFYRTLKEDFSMSIIASLRLSKALKQIN